MPNPYTPNNVEELRTQIGNVILGYHHAKLKSLEAAEAEIMSLFHKALEAKSLETARTLHNNIDVTFNLIEKIQPGYEGNRTIGAGELQRLLCEYEDELSNTPKTQEKE